MNMEPKDSGAEPEIAEAQTAPVPAGRPRRRWRTLLTVFVLLALSVGAVGFFFRDTLVHTRLGHWLIGMGTAPAGGATTYYCPMHPKYRSPKAGDCPICNMALVAETTEKSKADERRILYWQDPMNPERRSDKPGKAPDGMDLVPVYADAESAPMAPGTVRIDPSRQQLIGVTFGEVTEGPLVQSVRTVGRVTYDETRITRVQTKVDGWIEKVFADYTGRLVAKGEPLLSIYSPDLVATQQEHLLALRARGQMRASPYPELAGGAESLVAASRRRLELWDVSEADIARLERTGEPMKSLTLSAPNTGFVVTRNAFERQRVTPETELYTIVDLTRVWVLAEVYEYEAPNIRIGQSVRVTFAALPGEVRRGTVAYVNPQVDPQTRTLKVRVELANPGFRLKPDMYADVELIVDSGRRVSVPETAILDSGARKTVFVDQGEGRFEPREVQLGLRVGDRYVVLNGLRPGERVVTSGNFLIDAESRLKSATGGMGAPPDPVGEPAPRARPKTGTPSHSGHRTP